MNKEETYAFLDSKGISYEITEHKAVYNMAELADVELPHPEANAKNLFVRDDKKRQYYLITVKYRTAEAGGLQQPPIQCGLPLSQ